MIIGLAGKARSGKSEVAKHLVDKYGFVAVAFADSLKFACGEIFGLTPVQLHGELKETIDPFWQDTPRNILQKVGTECLRKGYRQDVWVKSLERRIVAHPTAHMVNWVVSDVRFPNEAEAIRAWGGKLVYISRPGAPSIGTPGHLSETALDAWDAWDRAILNDGTLEDLARHVDSMMAHIRR